MIWIFIEFFMAKYIAHLKRMWVFFFFGNVFIDKIPDQNPEYWKIFTTILSSRNEKASIIYKLEVYNQRTISFNGLSALIEVIYKPLIIKNTIRSERSFLKFLQNVDNLFSIQ